MTPDSKFKTIMTFTDEELLYDAETHHYTTLDGKPLLSGSAYAEWFAKPFDRPLLLARTAKKLGQTEELVGAAWDMRGELSRTFGNAVHKTMECWFKYWEIGYGLPKHPYLKKMVESFPRRWKEIQPEIMVSDLKRGFVGQIDALEVLGRHRALVIDYKSDAEVTKNLDKHFNQLSFYAHILMAHGWVIDEVQVWNYRDKWECFRSKVLPLNERAIEDKRRR